ncbi:MAG: serine/threonine-protein kinase [Gammaproteobacteria bacterium]|jgi:serine/threonine protein kinase
MSDLPPRKALLPRTALDCYHVVRLIGSGGFSLIYLARDDETQDEVAIKEYFPKRFGIRDEFDQVRVSEENKLNSYYRGLKLFFLEAKTLANMIHPNIVKVRNCFMANGSAYLVMDYEPGKNLGTYIKKRQGGLSTNFMMTVFPPLLDALNLMHSKQHLHLDIKPGNIHLRPGGNPLLLDFGAVHEVTETNDPLKAQIITPGFSPVEQYYSKGNIGPWTDVYAVGATMRACLDGKPPPSATELDAGKATLESAVDKFSERYPPWLLHSIDWAMEQDASNRPQSAAALRDVLLEQTGRPRNSIVPEIQPT